MAIARIVGIALVLVLLSIAGTQLTKLHETNLRSPRLELGPNVAVASPASGAKGISIGASANVVFSPLTASSTITPATFRLVDALGNEIRADVTYSRAIGSSQEWAPGRSRSRDGTHQGHQLIWKSK